MFTNRTQAGILLAEHLKRYKTPNTIVLAIPRGGLPLGAEISKALKAPLGVVLSKKIGHPNNSEYAIGAVSLKSVVLDKQADRVSQKYIAEAVKNIRKALLNKLELYYHDCLPPELKDKLVIITDDGVATGNTMLSTLELIHSEHPSKIVLAIPVAPPEAIEKLKHSPFVDEIICLETPMVFRAVGAFYEDFSQVSDQEAIALLTERRP